MLYPHDIHHLPIDFVKGVQFNDLLGIAKNLSLKDCDSKLAFLIKNLYTCLVERDCEEILINPLVMTKKGHFRAANPRITLDERSLYRQAEMLSLIDSTQLNHLERIAKIHDLRYMKMNDEDGNIGLITNGFGLSMATCDLIASMHGKAANLLDLFGASVIEDTLQALDLMQYDRRVKVVFINVFGGVIDISKMVDGIIKAVQFRVITKPLVIRLRGYFEDEETKRLSNFLDSRED